MAVEVIKNNNKSVNIILTNGHAEALEKVVKDYKIIDEERALGFILSVMRDAGGRPVKTIAGSFVPAEGIIKKDNQNNERTDNSGK